MAGVKVFDKLQFGKENVAGSAVTATDIWPGEGMMKDARERVFPNRGDATAQPSKATYLRKKGVEISLDDTPATYEQLPVLFGMGVEGSVSASTDADGTGKIRIYDLPTTAARTLDTYTWEGGDDQEVGESEYVFATDINLKWASGEELKMGGKLLGRQWTDAEFTAASQSGSTLHHIVTPKLFLDNYGATGSTQKTNTFMGWELNIPTGFKSVFSGDGELYFSTIKYVGNKDNPVNGVLRLEHDATGEAELNMARSGSMRLMRVLFEDDALGTAGSLYSTYTFRSDLTIQYTDVPELTDEDGNNQVELPFQVVYDENSSSTIAAGKFWIVNQRA